MDIDKYCVGSQEINVRENSCFVYREEKDKLKKNLGTGNRSPLLQKYEFRPKKERHNKRKENTN